VLPIAGLLKLLHVATQIPEQCEYPVSADTRQHNAICLARLYDDMVFDTKRAIFNERLSGFFNALLAKVDQRAVKIQLSAMLITLMQVLSLPPFRL
jgi:hypothetical protein